ncbi:MAG: PrsW family glutamic-type intramembrane protease [bacterium]
MVLVLTIIGAIAPSLLLLRFFYKRDVFPEPRGVLLKTFCLGFLSVAPILAVVFALRSFSTPPEHPVLGGLFIALMYAAIPEEFFKFCIVTGYSARNPAFDEPMDGVVYGATASLGFATLENILYVSGGGWTVAIVRAFSAVPAHACLGAILGYYVGQARFHPERRTSAWLGLLAATGLHGLYNFPLLAFHRINEYGLIDSYLDDHLLEVAGLLLLFVVTLSVMVVWTLRIVLQLRKTQLQVHEVEIAFTEDPEQE